MKQFLPVDKLHELDHRTVRAKSNFKFVKMLMRKILRFQKFICYGHFSKGHKRLDCRTTYQAIFSHQTSSDTTRQPLQFRCKGKFQYPMARNIATTFEINNLLIRQYMSKPFYPKEKNQSYCNQRHRFDAALED